MVTVVDVVVGLCCSFFTININKRIGKLFNLKSRLAFPKTLALSDMSPEKHKGRQSKQRGRRRKKRRKRKRKKKSIASRDFMTRPFGFLNDLVNT